MTINAKRNTNNPLVSFYTMISALVKKFGCFDKCTSAADQITASFELKKKQQNKVSSHDYALWGFKNFPRNGCLTWRLPGVWCQCNPCIFALITLPLHNTCLTYSGNWTNLYEPNVKPQRQNIFTNLYFKVSLSRMNFCQGFVTRLRLSFALSSLGVFDPGFLIMAFFSGWSVIRPSQHLLGNQVFLIVDHPFALTFDCLSWLQRWLLLNFLLDRLELRLDRLLGLLHPAVLGQLQHKISKPTCCMLRVFKFLKTCMLRM